jgi:hypothetical protein
MTDSERIIRLERVVAMLMDALDRRGTERDGNWGYPTFITELRGLRFYLANVDRQERRPGVSDFSGIDL